MKNNRHLRQLLSVLLVGCMLFSMLPAMTVFGAESTTSLEDVTLTATSTSATNRTVSGTGNKVLSFTAAITDPDGTLKANIKMYSNKSDTDTAKVEVLRFKLDRGNIKLSDLATSSYTTMAPYTKSETPQRYDLKLVMIPADGSNAATVKLYAVDGQTETQLGSDFVLTTEATLDELTRLSFNVDSNSSTGAQVEFTNIVYKTGVDLNPGGGSDPAASDKTVFDRDFDELSEGALSASTGVAVTGDVKVTDLAGNKVLEFTDNSTGSDISRVVFDFDEAASGEITITFKLHVISDIEGAAVETALDFTCGSSDNAGGKCNGSDRQILLLKTNGADSHRIIFRGRHTSTNSGNTSANNDSYAVDDWTQVKLVLNTDTGKFKVWSGEKELGEAELGYTTEKARDKIDNMAFLTESSAKAHAYIDDVKVTVKAASSGGGNDPVDPVDPVDPDPTELPEVWTPAWDVGHTFKLARTDDRVIAEIKSGVTLEVGYGTWEVAKRNAYGQSNLKYITCTDESTQLASDRGTFYRFAIPAKYEAGTLSVKIRVAVSSDPRQLMVLEDGNIYDGFAVPEATETTEYDLDIPVEGGHTYTLYALSNRPYLFSYGFTEVDREAQKTVLQGEVDALGFDFIKGQNTSATAVDKDLGLVNYWNSPTFGTCDIVWSADSPAVATDGTVDRLAEDTVVHVTGHFTVQQSNYLEADKIFTVTVKGFSDDTAAVAEAKEALTLGDISGVKKDLTLPSTGLHGTTITWASDNTDAVSNTGAVHPLDTNTQTATLTATISRGSATPVTKTFTVTVAIARIVDVNSWAYATAGGQPRFAPVDGGKLHTINVTANQDLDATYKLQVEILNADGTAKSPAVKSQEMTVPAILDGHGVGVSMPVTLDLPMGGTDRFNVKVYTGSQTFVNFTTTADDGVMDPGAKVYVVGDSTAALYNDTAYPQTGWAQVLDRFFDNVEVVDLGIGGRSSLDYKKQNQYKSLQSDIRAGDYLLIQFGHNDSKEADPTLYTDPAQDRFADGAKPSYKKSMAEFVTLAWEKGAHPVLLTSISRGQWKNNAPNDPTGQLYADAARELAAELSIPCLDLHADTTAWMTRAGADHYTDMFLVLKAQDSRFYYDSQFTSASKYWNGNENSKDYTHVNINGAKLIAMYAADALQEQLVPLGAKRNSFSVPETLAAYVDASSGPKTPAGIGRIDFSATNWKLQLPVAGASAGSVKEVAPAEVAAGYKDEYFYADVDDAGEYAVVFHTPVEGAKTANTEYCRSELREMLDAGDAKVNWSWEGTHVLETEEAVTHVPAGGSTITSQIHAINPDGTNAPPLVKVRYMKNASFPTGAVRIELKQDAAGTTDSKKDLVGVELGQKFTTRIQVKDGVVTVTVTTVDPATNQEKSLTHSLDFVGGDAGWKDLLYYFKVGNYIQDKTDTGAEAYADVWVYDTAVTHETEASEALPADGAVTVTGGQSAVTQAYTASGTGNKSLSFTLTPTATAGLSGGVKFYENDTTGSKVEVLRLMLDAGTIKIAEVSGAKETKVTTLGTYTANTACGLKLVLLPASGSTAKAYAKVYQGDALLGVCSLYDAMLTEVTQLAFFANAGASGTFAYTGVTWTAPDSALTEAETAEPETVPAALPTGTVKLTGARAGVSESYAVTGADDKVQIFTFTVTPGAVGATNKNNCAVKFKTAEGEVIRLKLDALTSDLTKGNFKINTGSGSYTQLNSNDERYVAGQSYTVRVKLTPKTDTTSAKAQVYLVSGNTETQLGSDYTVEGALNKALAVIDVALDSGSSGTFTLQNFKFQTADVPAGGTDPVDPPVDPGQDDPENLLSKPSDWTVNIPERVSVTTEKLTVTAASGANTSAYGRIGVAGAGNQVLTFTMKADGSHAGTVANQKLSGMVKFYVGSTETLRLKLNAGIIQFGGATGAVGSYETPNVGTYEPQTPVTIKTVIVPADSEQMAFVKFYKVEGSDQTKLAEYTVTVAGKTLESITRLDFATDSDRIGSFEFSDMTFQSNVQLSEEESTPPGSGGDGPVVPPVDPGEDDNADAKFLLKHPKSWTLSSNASIYNAQLTVNAGTESSSNRIDVTGAGVKTLSFDVEVRGTDLKNIKGGINFAVFGTDPVTNKTNPTVVRFKMQGGIFRLYDRPTANDSKVYSNIDGNFDLGDKFNIKLELFPATAKTPAYVRAYKDGEIICKRYELKTGDQPETLESIDRVYVFADSNSAGSYVYSNMVYTTGPKTPVQTDVVDFAGGGWELVTNGQSVTADQLREGYADESFSAGIDADCADVLVLHPAAGGVQLREKTGAGDTAATRTWNGTHTLRTTQSVTAAGQSVTARLLGGDLPAATVRYVCEVGADTGKVVVTFLPTTAEGAETVEHEFPDVAPGQVYQTTIQEKEGVVTVTVSTVDAGGESRAESYTCALTDADPAWKSADFSFDVGPAAQGGADVWLYGATVKHEVYKPAPGTPGERPSTSQSDYSDGSSTTVETWASGATVVTQTAANGDTIRTEEAADGTVAITVKAQNGNASIAVASDGATRGKVELAETAVSRAQRTGEALTLPVPQLTPGKDPDRAPVLELVQKTAATVKVKAPVKGASGTVPVAVKADGTEEIIKMSVPDGNSVLFELTGSATVKLVDNAIRFDDVPAGHWASGAVDFASGRELLLGTGGAAFSPDGLTTRGMIVTLLARLAGADTAGGESWYSKGMDWAVAGGISDGTDPEANISREQFVTMLYRYAGQPAAPRAAVFADSETISAWASDAMAWATGTGIMRGRTDGTLDPAGTATRAEAATLLMRYCMWKLGVELEVAGPAEEQGAVAIDYSFDDMELDRSWAPGTKVVDYDGRRVVEVTDSDPDATTALNYMFPAQAGEVTISFKACIDPEAPDSVLVMTAGAFALTGRYSSNSNGEYLRVKTTGESRKFQFRGGDSTKTASTTAGGYRPGEWFEVKVVLSTDTNAFTVYIDGEMAGGNTMSSKGNAPLINIDNISFMTEKAGLAHYYVDDVKVTGKLRDFSIWDESVDNCLALVGAAGAGLLDDPAKWQLKQGEIRDGALIVTGGVDSASNKIAVSGSGNKALSFTVVPENDTGAKGGVRFVSGGAEVMRFKLEAGKFKITDMRLGENGKVAYQNLGTYTENTACEVRILILQKTATQSARVKLYLDGQQAGSDYILSEEAAEKLQDVTQLNFFTDSNADGTLTYTDMSYRAGKSVGEEAGEEPAGPELTGPSPAATGCIDFIADGWKLQIPIENPGKAGSVMELSPSQLAGGYTDEYFYAAEDEEGTPAVVFHSPVKGYKTGNTKYARSEMRELLDPSDSKVNWTWQGSHTLVTEERVTHVPASGQTITSQIHGIEQNGDNANPLVKVRYVYNYAKETGAVRVELKDTTAPTSYDYKYDFPNVALGQKFKTEIHVFDGVVCVTISTTDPDGTERSETYRHDFVNADPYWKETWYYFKLGNYIQDDKDESDGAYADVWVYSSKITHSDTVDQVKVTDITMDQSAVSIRSGERTGLSVTAAPMKAYDRSVTWAVTEGQGVAVVDKDGYVTGVKEGVATITATSVSNPAAKTSVDVTVKDVAVVEVKPVFALDFDAAAADPAALTGPGVEVSKDAPAGTDVSVVNENGNGVVTLKDESADPAKLSFVFEPRKETTTIAFKVRVDALGEHTEGKGDFGRMYIVAAGSDDWYDNDTEIFRIRNNAKGTLGNFSGLSYVLTERYEELPMNADKVLGSLGDWVDVTFVVTPDNGTAKANTTDIYMNGYPVAMAMANRNTVSYVNRLDVQTGSADQLTFSVDDVKVYTGIVLPENTALIKPDTVRLVRLPAVMAVQDSVQVDVEVAPTEGYEKMKYSVASGDAACISEDGYVTAVKAGTAVIRAESVLDSAIFAQQTITVQESVVRPQSIQLPATLRVGPGETARLDVTVLPADTTEKSVKFEVISGSDVASVDSQGNITGKAVGSAVIRVTCLSDAAVFGTVTVSVTKTMAPGEVVFTDDFDAGALDGAYWTTTLAKDNTFVRMDDGALTLIDANAAANPKVNLAFTPVSGKVSIQFRVKVGGEVTIQGGSVKSTGYRNHRIAFGAGNLSATANESFCIRGNGTHFTYNTTGATYVELPGDYNVADWNEVTFVTNISAEGPDTTDVYINGVKVLAGAANKVDYPAIDALCLSADTASFAAFSIDDLAIWAGDYADKPAGLNARRFRDVPAGHWAAEAIDFVCDKGVMSGVGGGSFAPDAITTRATVVTLLARLDGVDTAGGETWYAKATQWAVDKGVSDGTDPDGAISREQFVTMLYRYAGSPAVAGQSLSAFADSGAVSPWAADAVAWAVNAGLMKGRTDGTLDPAGSLSRAEAAALLSRYCQ